MTGNKQTHHVLGHQECVTSTKPALKQLELNGSGRGTWDLQARGRRGDGEGLPPLTSQWGKLPQEMAPWKASAQTYEETQDARRSTSEERG